MAIGPILARIRAAMNRPAPVRGDSARPADGDRPSSSGRYPNGHFYSPVIDPAEISAAAQRIWPSEPNVVGIDFNAALHHELLRDVFPRYIRDYDYPATLPEGAASDRFFDRNPAFGWLDSRALFVLLRHWRPRRLVEVGSGYSTLLMADVNRRFLGGAMRIRCIEPYPPAFLTPLPPGIFDLLRFRVQDVPFETFSDLVAGDVLFIDSSHVSKIGSDVNHLVFEVIPRLAPGVRIHFHDIFLPFEYPREWVLDLGLYWNEQYLVRALLTLNARFRIIFGSTYASRMHTAGVCAALSLTPGSLYGGGSLWIEKLA
jgi:hypothetical protein